MKIVRHIPNTVTSMNLLCGVLGVIAAFNGRPDYAFYLILAASVCDFCDGLSARALNAYSEIGKELDSLADLVSFGLLPSIMLNRYMVAHSGEVFWSYIPLVIVMLSALRLAKFNVDERQRDNFIGLAVPANAIFCGALVHYVYTVPDSFLTVWASGNVFIPVISVILSLMLVSELPMFSLKFKKGQKKDTVIYKLRFGFIALCLAVSLMVLLLRLKFSMIFILAVAIYIIMNIVNYISTPKSC
ncbi:MAG: CDP-alcohol phosphatidyltransferase family protein [Bacteroidales bacterium]|nr:CDP-alcohol phosphatidyltransferase family protein [Bacteroides sp.]MCM1501058.1 CDP-alcohol phosphatidyltransferase family protein [Bacteroidales bacterium]